MRYQIPQFIETEDKIIGPLTLKQFLYLAGFGGFALILFFIFDGITSIIITIPLFAVGGAFAFVKINGMPLPRYLASMFGFAFNTKEYTWKTGPQRPQEERVGIKDTPEKESNNS